MNVSDAIMNFLKEEEVNTIFGYPGGAVLPLYKSLKKSHINHILVRHEQSAIHAASGYALSTKKTGVCIATSGPGATNLITGIANAYMDSIPVIIITGQVPTNVIGSDSFQEADIIGATEAFTKHNYLVKSKNNIGKIFREAFHIANTGRKGPVLIDIPKNIQEEIIDDYNYPKNINIPGYNPTENGNDYQIEKALEKINSSKKPLLCVGSGILLSQAKEELYNFVETTQIPITTTLKGKGSFNENHPLYAGMIGSHGHEYANHFINSADLLIIIGMSISNRATANFSVINKNIIHIDIDPAEVGKNIDTNLPIVGDAKNILTKLNNLSYNLSISNWKDFIKKEKILKNNYLGKNIFINEKLSEISDNLPKDAIILADVGNNQISAAHCFKMYEERIFITSGGLGTMGFSLPASIGAQIGNQNKQIIAVIGDGGFQMCMNELITFYENNLNIKIILIDNQSLGMVRDLQKTHYNETFSVDFKCSPNFEKICNANSVEYYNLNSSKKIKEFLNDKSIALGHIILKEETYE